MLSRLDANNYEWDRWHASALTNDVVKLALIVGDARTHLALKRLHRKYFNSNVNMVAYVESEVFDE